MRIEVLYVPGCPNYQPAVVLVREVLASESLQADVHGVAVSSDEGAKVLRFPGSPTIRIDGDDVEPSHASSFGLSCRLTPTEAEFHQRKSFDWLSEQSVRSEITMRVAERATPVAAVIAALSTLACCLPFGFLGAMGLASLSVWAQSFRNWFIGGAAVLLFVGFVQLYRGRNQCKKRSPVSVGLFWVAVAIVLLIALFPQVIASLVAG